MPNHTQAKEAVTAQKIVGVSEAEVQNAIIGLRLLTEDSEVSSGDKGQAMDLHRMLLGNLTKGQARTELMQRAVALVNRIA